MRGKRTNPVIENQPEESTDPVQEETSCKIRQWFERNNDLFFYIIMTILALLVRWAFIPFQSGDLQLHMGNWYTLLKSGGLSVLKNEFADYPIAYLLLIWLSSLLPLLPVVGVKLISFIFDFIGAYFVALLVKEKYQNPFVIISSSIVALFAPTVILNSAVWGQCDMVYTATLLATICFLIKEKPWPAFIWYGIGFSLKIQVVFLAPLLLFMLLKQKVKLYHFLIIPAVYILTVLPSLFAGRSFSDVMLIYFKLSDEMPGLTWGFPNIYQWFGNGDYQMFKNAGIAATAAAVSFLGYLSYKSKRIIDQEFILRLSLLSLLVVPFLLPNMHERYYFPADVLSIVLAFYRPKYTYAAVTISLVSFFSYSENLFGAYIIQPKFLAIPMLLLIIKLTYDFVKFLSFVDTADAPMSDQTITE